MTTARWLRIAIGTETARSATKQTTRATVPAVDDLTVSSWMLAEATSSASPTTLPPAATRSTRRSGVSNTQCEATTVITTCPATMAWTATMGMVRRATTVSTQPERSMASAPRYIGCSTIVAARVARRVAIAPSRAAPELAPAEASAARSPRRSTPSSLPCGDRRSPLERRRVVRFTAPRPARRAPWDPPDEEDDVALDATALTMVVLGVAVGLVGVLVPALRAARRGLLVVGVLLVAAGGVFGLVATDEALRLADAPVLGWMIAVRSTDRTALAETVSLVGGTTFTAALALVAAVVLALRGGGCTPSSGSWASPWAR